MRFVRALFVQLQATRTALIASFATCAVVLGIVGALHRWGKIPLGHLTRDPSAIVGAGPHLGFLSNMGIVFWSAAAAVCALSAAVAVTPRGRQFKAFLYASAAFTIVLALDDLFMLHETVFPDHLGIPEMVVYLGYATLAAAYLLGFVKTIMQTEYLLLGLALCFFALSVGMDLIGQQFGAGSQLEDSAKLAGIVMWLTYHIRVAVSVLLPASDQT